MRLDIYISTDVLSPRKRSGTYHATWIGFGSSGKKLGEDGTFDTDFDNQYGMLVKALKEASGHINANARPEVRICCSNGLIIQAIKNLKSWEARDFRKKNGQLLSHSEDWRFIASRLKGLYFKVEGGRDGSHKIGNC